MAERFGRQCRLRQQNSWAGKTGRHCSTQMSVLASEGWRVQCWWYSRGEWSEDLKEEAEQGTETPGSLRPAYKASGCPQ